MATIKPIEFTWAVYNNHELEAAEIVGAGPHGDKFSLTVESKKARGGRKELLWKVRRNGIGIGFGYTTTDRREEAKFAAEAKARGAIEYLYREAARG